MCVCAGWGGWGCTDDSAAQSYKRQLTATLLLTLSNLFFLPAIIVAAKRCYITEASVYLFTMFFSTVTHTETHIPVGMLRCVSGIKWPELLVLGSSVGERRKWKIEVAELEKKFRLEWLTPHLLCLILPQISFSPFLQFYHACDQPGVAVMCIMDYDALQYCDFLGSVCSIWVTILCMARIRDTFKYVRHRLFF